jgi:hypothetical protein
MWCAPPSEQPESQWSPDRWQDGAAWIARRGPAGKPAYLSTPPQIASAVFTTSSSLRF